MIDNLLDNEIYKDRLMNKMPNGKCFIYRTINDVKHFYPSRLIGYTNYDIESYLTKNANHGDGKDTNSRINKILKDNNIINDGKSIKAEMNNNLQIEFNRYFNINSDTKQVKFWDYDFYNHNEGNTNNQ